MHLGGWLCGQTQEAQLQVKELELESLRRQRSGSCASCLQLDAEVEHLRKGHRELSEEKTKLEAELEDLRLQLRRMSPYGGSPLGRIRELELQFTEVCVDHTAKGALVHCKQQTQQQGENPHPVASDTCTVEMLF